MMSTAYRCIALALAAAVTAATLGAAQMPRISNGQVSVQPAGASFVQSFQALVSSSADVTWIGYQVPAIRRDAVMCCASSGTTWVSGSLVTTDGSTCCSACRIEPAASATASMSGSVPAQGPVKLEGPDTLLVLFRVVDRQVERIRMFSEGCELDAGGSAVRWLEQVKPADSIALLETFIPPAEEGRSRTGNSAVAAIAMHAAPEGGAAIDRLATSHASSGVRGEALFWIAQRGGAGAERTILQAMERDQSSAVRKKAVFALSQLPDATAVPALLRIARTDAAPAIRGEAIFWLGQKAGRKAAGDITERIEQDPDTEVKKRAVFALSLLPKDDGVPLLIQVARTNPNAAVKKQAIFWLGQSKDPRALDFFAQILK